MHTDSSSPPKPGCWSLLAGFLLVFQIIQVISVLNIPERIRQVLLVPPELQLILAGIWGLLFAVALVTLAKDKDGALPYTQLLISSFVLYRLLRRVVFAQATVDSSHLSFFVGLTVCLLTVPIITLLRQSWRSVHQ